MIISNEIYKSVHSTNITIWIPELPKNIIGIIENISLFVTCNGKWKRDLNLLNLIFSIRILYLFLKSIDSKIYLLINIFTKENNGNETRNTAKNIGWINAL